MDVTGFRRMLLRMRSEQSDEARAMRRILISAVIIFCLIGLFPPWIYTVNPPGTGQITNPAGYSVLFSPPPPEKSGPRYGVEIDLPRLLIQWAILIVAIGGYIFLRGHAHANRVQNDKE